VPGSTVGAGVGVQMDALPSPFNSAHFCIIPQSTCTIWQMSMNVSAASSDDWSTTSDADRWSNAFAKSVGSSRT
jgi:hypothetical protein